MKIYQVPDDRRYWVVRAESGRYFEHFIKEDIIALGHLNQFGLPDTEGRPFLPELKELRALFLSSKNIDPEKKRKNSLHLSQVKSFLHDMQVGDWVMTVGHFTLRVGRVLSKPYIDKKCVEIVHDEERRKITKMDFELRRKVQWGPSISRRDLPFGLVQSLKANQTLVCLDSRWEAIYHTLYPAFTKENTLYLSAKIKTEDRIRNHNLSGLFRLLDEVEVIGKEFSTSRNINDFERTFEKYVANDLLTITTKAAFNSPGDIWNAISSAAGAVNIQEWAAYTLTAYSMIFGNKLMGFDGLIDLQTRQKLWDLVIDRVKKNGAEKAVDTLKLELPNLDTSKLEDSSNDQP